MHDLENKRILITGGAGFVGSHLVDALIQKVSHLTVLDDLSTGNTDNIHHHIASPKFSFVKGSILDKEIVNQCIHESDYIFHLATLGVRHSLKYPEENHRVNTEGTFNILETARHMTEKRVIHCSTSEVYGTAVHVPMSETHPTFPHTVYGASKLAAEAYVRAYHLSFGLSTTIIRPFNMFGPRSHYEKESGELIPKSIVRALNNEPILIFGNGEQTRDFTFVIDTVNAMIRLAQSDGYTGKSYNIGSEFEISVTDVAKKILNNLPQSTSQLQFLEDRPGDVTRLFADSSLFFDTFSFQHQYTFDQGLKQTIQWFETHPEGCAHFMDDEMGINWK